MEMQFNEQRARKNFNVHRIISRSFYYYKHDRLFTDNLQLLVGIRDIYFTPLWCMPDEGRKKELKAQRIEIYGLKIVLFCRVRAEF
jgi:hypothetical protein